MMLRLAEQLFPRHILAWEQLLVDAWPIRDVSAEPFLTDQTSFQYCSSYFVCVSQFRKQLCLSLLVRYLPMQLLHLFFIPVNVSFSKMCAIMIESFSLDGNRVHFCDFSVLDWGLDQMSVCPHQSYRLHKRLHCEICQPHNALTHDSTHLLPKHVW